MAAEQNQQMSVEENKLIVQRFWHEVVNGRNLDVADELFASDHVLYEQDLPTEERGPYTVKSFVTIVHKTSPDILVDIQDEIAAADKVVSRWTARGSLAEELKSAAASNDEVTISGISIFRVSDGEIKETWQQIEAPRNDAQAAMLPEEVQAQWLSNDQQFSELLGDLSKWKRIICRICHCC